MNKEIVSIKSVLNAVIGESKASKYIQKPEGPLYDANSIYQAALTHLLSGKTEKAIIHIVYGLDLERENVQLLHLCKTMLLSISEYLFENNAEVYRQKYSDLSKAEVDINKSLKDYDKRIETSGSRLRELNRWLIEEKPTFFSFNKFFVVYYFKSKKVIKEIAELEESISYLNDETTELKKDLKNVAPLVKVDEYSKVLGLIIEVCTFPTRYEWTMNKK
ncbi:MAG: hypothetical protein U0457_21395 [Candidatus Sericytochromatia bacterium]